MKVDGEALIVGAPLSRGATATTWDFEMGDLSGMLVLLTVNNNNMSCSRPPVCSTISMGDVLVMNKSLLCLCVSER